MGIEINVKLNSDANTDSSPGRSQKELVEELKVQWRSLWRERIDDKEKAEGISTNDYIKLFVEKGTVIHATRDFKALNFKEILELHEITNSDRYIQPSKNVGGWSRFIKTNITNQPVKKHRRAAEYLKSTGSIEKSQKQQPKKGGRGWLHK